MDLFVFTAVLTAAACHAGWNALLKIRLEPLVAISLIASACGVLIAPLIPLVGLPEPAAWPYLVTSLLLHFVYYLALAEAYRYGDLSQVYPIARGAAPLLTAACATVWLGETLRFESWLGIGLLASGILMLSVKGQRRHQPLDVRSVGFALLTALSIAGYTLVDGTGGRIGASPAAYIVWLFALDGAAMLVVALLLRPGAFLAGARGAWPLVLVGGALSIAAYAIAIWAMTVAPIALVAALRESSVLFAALIGIVFLREPLLLPRVLAAVLVVAGMAALRLR
jgi:drug/metabolite transporter (DMT)-like permease